MTTITSATLLPADERHLEALMTVMRAGFDPQFGEAWSAAQLSGTLGMAGSFARQALAADDAACGFTLCRSAGPEVELLLIAVTPAARGQGLGLLLLEAACKDALQRGASDLFLEVRENNLGARALYRKAGFRDVGRRADYYAGSSGRRFAAITMRRHLGDLL